MKKILIIEDDQSIAELQRDYLEIEEFIVEIEDDGEKGLQRALNEHYDFIILDLMLPKQSGFEICRKLRKVKETPIMIVSAKKEDFDKIRALGLGADDYMVKPFSPSELVARVKAHLARYDRLIGTKQQETRTVTIGHIKIDQEDHRIYAHGEEMIMTAKEYDLLVFLATNPNRVFSKEQLFEKIWGFDAYGDTSTVTVHIRKLREKVELEPSNPRMIETIWGAGYRFKL
ncbi:response regulator transcription factor [Anaerobacillus sp. CMMVII]|uniref:response regulator transcription factor n=1 Tax=Anaerobacillus sp. CMMVII TaxID=2755588 RepID=UPI0021B84CD2|nr:response regulator transcription factor [Anaerobacillus sp. CMMVII]MCT8139245.1 response regulator transcription factor [Anaerobacillus sp. CMMVII]